MRVKVMIRFAIPSVAYRCEIVSEISCARPFRSFCFAIWALGAPPPQNPCVSHFFMSSQNSLILLPREPKICSLEIDSFRAVCV